MKNIVRVGARDYCRHCGLVISLRNPDDKQLSRFPDWWHIESNERWCLGTHQRAEPKMWCWESMKNSWFISHCGRPVKDPDRFMCGIHAAHARKQEKREEEWDESWEISNHIEEQLLPLAEMLKEAYGLDVDLESKDFRYTGRIIVDPSKLMEILEEVIE